MDGRRHVRGAGGVGAAEGGRAGWAVLVGMSVAQGCCSCCFIRRKVQTPGTAREHKKQIIPTINPNDHQSVISRRCSAVSAYLEFCCLQKRPDIIVGKMLLTSKCAINWHDDLLWVQVRTEH